MLHSRRIRKRCVDCITRECWADGRGALKPKHTIFSRLTYLAVYIGQLALGSLLYLHEDDCIYVDMCSMAATLRTLPLSGRQGACGGVAESWWWPVRSRGLFEETIQPRDNLHASISLQEPFFLRFFIQSQYLLIGCRVAGITRVPIISQFDEDRHQEFIGFNQRTKTLL